MKQTIFLFFFWLQIAAFSHAQNQYSTWVLENRFLLAFPPDSGQAYQTFEYPYSSSLSMYGHTQIADSAGHLLFYTSDSNNALGTVIRNRAHEIMPQGYSNNGQNGYPGYVGQRDIIVPSPTDKQQYYLFRTTRRRSTTTEYLCIEDTASYSIVDMRLAGGMGDIAQDTEGNLLKDIRLYPRPSSCKITATRRSACGRSYWILTHDLISNAFYAYLLDSVGLHAPVISQAGSVFSSSFVSSGQRKYIEGGCMKFSRDGTCVVAAVGSSNTVSKVEFFNFDKHTGQVSLRESIDYKALWPYSGPWGVPFSPNDSLIYVGMINTVYQYDRYATSLAGSTVLLTIPDTNPYTWYNKHYNILQLAPNGRIYTLRRDGNLYNSTGQPTGYTRGWLSEIRYPNRRGLHSA